MNEPLVQGAVLAMVAGAGPLTLNDAVAVRRTRVRLQRELRSVSAL